MSDYGGDDDEEWLEEMWFVDDVEDLPGTLAPTAYAHSPPYAPDAYDAYDSDFDEYYTDGDDDYFDGPPRSPSPTSSPNHLHHHQSPTPKTIYTPPTPSTISTTTTTSPAPTPHSEFLSRLEARYQQAISGKRFYGEQQAGDEVFLAVGRRRKLAPAARKREEGVRKRRKIVHASEIVQLTGMGVRKVVREVVGVVEIGSRDGGDSEIGVGEELPERDDDGSAEGYNSDRESVEELQPAQQSQKYEPRKTTLEVIIHAPNGKLSRSTSKAAVNGDSGGVPGGTSDDGGGGGRWAGGTGRRRAGKSPAPPPAPPPTGTGAATNKKTEVIVGGGRRVGGKRRNTPLRE